MTQGEASRTDGTSANGGQVTTALSSPPPSWSSVTPIEIEMPPQNFRGHHPEPVASVNWVSSEFQGMQNWVNRIMYEESMKRDMHQAGMEKRIEELELMVKSYKGKEVTVFEGEGEKLLGGEEEA